MSGLEAALEEARYTSSVTDERLMTEAEELQAELTATQEALAREKSAREGAEAALAIEQTEHERASKTREMLRSVQDALAVSEAAVATMHGANTALERRAADAEAALDQANASIEMLRANGEAASEERGVAVTSQQTTEAELARAQAELIGLRERIQMMVEHHSDHRAQAEADAEDAAILRDESVRLHAQLTSLEAALADEVRRREAAEATLRSAHLAVDPDAAADDFADGSSTALVVGGAHSQHVIARMREQRERLESLQLELARSQAAVAQMQRSRGSTGGGFGEALVKKLGGAVCLGTERKSTPAHTLTGPPRGHRDNTEINLTGPSRGRASADWQPHVAEYGRESSSPERIVQLDELYHDTSAEAHVHDARRPHDELQERPPVRRERDRPRGERLDRPRVIARAPRLDRVLSSPRGGRPSGTGDGTRDGTRPPRGLSHVSPRPGSRKATPTRTARDKNGRELPAHQSPAKLKKMRPRDSALTPRVNDQLTWERLVR